MSLTDAVSANPLDPIKEIVTGVPTTDANERTKTAREIIEEAVAENARRVNEDDPPLSDLDKDDANFISVIPVILFAMNDPTARGRVDPYTVTVETNDAPSDGVKQRVSIFLGHVGIPVVRIDVTRVFGWEDNPRVSRGYGGAKWKITVNKKTADWPNFTRPKSRDAFDANLSAYEERASHAVPLAVSSAFLRMKKETTKWPESLHAWQNVPRKYNEYELLRIRDAMREEGFSVKGVTNITGARFFGVYLEKIEPIPLPVATEVLGSLEAVGRSEKRRGHCVTM